MLRSAVHGAKVTQTGSAGIPLPYLSVLHETLPFVSVRMQCSPDVFVVMSVSCLPLSIRQETNLVLTSPALRQWASFDHIYNNNKCISNMPNLIHV